MARPKKENELKHSHRIYLHLTDIEYEIVSENVKAPTGRICAQEALE